MVTDWVLLSN